MSTIKETVSTVRSFVKGEGDAAKTTYCFNGKIYVSEKQLRSRGYSNPKALISQTIVATFYTKGESLINGKTCTEDNKILKDFEIEATNRSIDFAMAANEGVVVKL